MPRWTLITPSEAIPEACIAAAVAFVNGDIDLAEMKNVWREYQWILRVDNWTSEEEAELKATMYRALTR